MRNLVLSLALALCAVSANAAESRQYVFVVNDSPNTLTSLRAIAADGTTTEFAKDVPMQGNENAYVQFASNTKGKAGCVYTVEATFSRGEPLTVLEYNACKAKSLHLGTALRQGIRNGG